MGGFLAGFFGGFKKAVLWFLGVEIQWCWDEERTWWVYTVYRGPSCSGCSCFDMIDVDFQAFNLPQIRYLDMKKYPPGKELTYPTEPEREQTLTQTYLEWGYVTVPSTVRERSKWRERQLIGSWVLLKWCWLWSANKQEICIFPCEMMANEQFRIPGLKGCFHMTELHFIRLFVWTYICVILMLNISHIEVKTVYTVYMYSETRTRSRRLQWLCHHGQDEEFVNVYHCISKKRSAQHDRIYELLGWTYQFKYMTWRIFQKWSRHHPVRFAEEIGPIVVGRAARTTYLEDHPRTSKWLITMVPW